MMPKRPTRPKRPKVVGQSSLDWARELTARLSNPTTGAELREIRQAFGFTQARVAEWWGVDPRYVRKLEAMPTLPAGYRQSAASLSRGIAVTPQRRRTKTGGLARTRGGQKRPKAEGLEVARVSPSTTAGEVIVRERVDWMPRDGIARPGRSRETVLGELRDRIAAAQSRGEDVIVTVDVNVDNPGASAAGYDVILTSGHGLTKPKGGQVIQHDDDSWMTYVSEEWLDELADDEGLTYDR